MTHGTDGFIILDAPSLAERTTMRLGGEAVAEVRLAASANYERLPGLLAGLGGEARVLGAGSNLLVGEGKLAFLLVTLSPESAVQVVKETEHSVFLRVRAGMGLPALIAKASALGLAGLEGLSGIPGSVGGAVAMNAGSFGASMGALVRGTRLFSPLLGFVERQSEAFDFSYRKCVLQGHMGWFVLDTVTLELGKSEKSKVRARIQEILQKKRAGQPVSARSAGCIFKNPSPEEPAGKLLDEAGFRGRRLGGMVFSSVHANFLVNEGSGTFAQAMELIAMAREAVRTRFGHTLELEVQIWP